MPIELFFLFWSILVIVRRGYLWGNIAVLLSMISELEPFRFKDYFYMKCSKVMRVF